LSGFQIFNAHPALYWGPQSQFNRPLLKMEGRANADGSVTGIISVGDYEFNTTGLFGASKDSNGDLQPRGFPSWLTIPGPQWLAMGRRWHFFFAWMLVITGLIYVSHSLYTGHFRRDLWPESADWRGIGQSIIDHTLLRHPKGEASARYNILQRVSYLAVIFLLVPLMVLTGLAMSPRMDTVLSWFLMLVGGRQSARTLHFIVTFALVAFVAVHLFEVLVTGAVNNLRSIITGRFRVEPEQESRNVAS
ncbi:MAG TPA: cytochrome b/b6 domain-containing protein, partial [Lacipirellulaceae bacterium]|nr:cytochrome b/b6 domain-containing protein [Lacipirellulaceae bacterium]